MSKAKDTTRQDARARRSAEALRENLKRRKLQARDRAAAAGNRAARQDGGPDDTEKPGR